MELFGNPGDDAFLGKNELPGIDLDEIARPERHHHCKVKQRFESAFCITGGKIGDGKSDRRGGEGHQCGHGDGAHNDLEIRLFKELRIGG